MSHTAGLFHFEGDFQTDLRCIPMVVRHRLDEVGIKLSLKEWVKLGRRMGAAPDDCAIDPAPAWADRSRVPDEVAAKAVAEGVALTPAQWAGLADLQRFALYKLSRSSHKNENFGPACREFGVDSRSPIGGDR